MNRWLLLATVPALVAGAANAQLVVGVDENDEWVYLINVTTDTATPLFTGYEVWGLAADNANRMLYFNAGGDLYRVPYNTLVPEFVAELTYQGSRKAPVSLAFSPRTGMLYATTNISIEAVYEVNPTNGVMTLLYAYNTAYDFGGLDYETGLGAFYGTNDSSTGPGGRGLFKIDPFGQSEQFIVGYPGGYTDIDGLGTGGGKAYFVIDEPGAIYVYDLQANAWADPLTSPFTTSEIFSGGAWAPGLIPEPAGLSILALGVMGLLRMRRK